MCADGKVGLPGGEQGEDFALLLCCERARELHDADAEGGEKRREGINVLTRENFGRGHERALQARAVRRPDAGRRDESLAAADVALYEPVHRAAGGHVR